MLGRSDSVCAFPRVLCAWYNQRDGTKVAVKEFRQANYFTIHEQEIEVLKSIPAHKNIVRLFAAEKEVCSAYVHECTCTCIHMWYVRTYVCMCAYSVIRICILVMVYARMWRAADNCQNI